MLGLKRCSKMSNIVHHEQFVDLVFTMDQLPTLHSVSERLRYLRARLEVTRAELAERLHALGAPNASVMTIRRNEGGERSPSLDELRALARLAGVPLAWVTGDENALVRTPGQDPESCPGVPPAGLLIIGQLEAELSRREEGLDVGGPQEAFAFVEDTVLRMRANRTLSDDGWYYWLALRRGAVLSGGYDPPETGPPDTDSHSSEPHTA